MRIRSWGDLASSTTSGTDGGGGGKGEGTEDDGIQDLYMDTISHVPLPQFLSRQDATVIDASEEMVGQGLSHGAGDRGGGGGGGKLALREVIRSMHSISEKPMVALSEIIEYIRKQQDLPLIQRDWDKAKRYELAHDFLTTGGSGGGSGGSGGRGSLLQDPDEFTNLMCDYL
jgi:hypothetical protein